jgi:hypothetical protein
MNSVRNKLEEALLMPVSIKINNSKKPELNNGEDSSNITSEIPSKIVENELDTSPIELSKNDFLLISSIPDKFHLNARNLLLKLKQNKKLIRWDEGGHVTFFENEDVPGSNIVDLINYSVRDLKWANNPAGINRFLAVCKLLNVPSHLLSREVKKDWYGTLDDLKPRITYTNSAQKIEKFKNHLRNWEPLYFEDTLDDDNDDDLDDETLQFQTPPENT